MLFPDGSHYFIPFPRLSHMGSLPSLFHTISSLVSHGLVALSPIKQCRHSLLQNGIKIARIGSIEKSREVSARERNALEAWRVTCSSLNVCWCHVDVPYQLPDCSPSGSSPHHRIGPSALQMQWLSRASILCLQYIEQSYIMLYKQIWTELYYCALVTKTFFPESKISQTTHWTLYTSKGQCG